MLAYGESDEYSFVFKKNTTLYGSFNAALCPWSTAHLILNAAMLVAGRRASKLVSTVVSLFTATYVRRWGTYLPSQPLLSTPCFDGRAVLYPSDRNLRDYLAWRQVDTHVNNQVVLLFRLPRVCARCGVALRRCADGCIACRCSITPASGHWCNPARLPQRLRRP